MGLISWTLCCAVLSHSVMSNSLQPHGLELQALLSEGFSRQEYWSELPCPPPDSLLIQWIKPRSPTLQANSLPSEPPGKPKNTGVGSLSLLPGIFPTQESNQGLLHYRQILYQLRYQGSPMNSVILPKLRNRFSKKDFNTHKIWWCTVLSFSNVYYYNWSLKMHRTELINQIFLVFFTKIFCSVFNIKSIVKRW